MVATSLGAVAWLHVAAGRAWPPVDRVLVARRPARTAEALPRFVPARLDGDAVRASARRHPCSSAATPEPVVAPGGSAPAYAEPPRAAPRGRRRRAHFALDDGGFACGPTGSPAPRPRLGLV